MRNLVSFLLTLVLLNTCKSAPISCPSSEDLSPCACKRLAFGLVVTCVNFDENSTLLKAFKVLRGYRIESVLLHGLKLQEALPNNLFEGLDIREMRVENSKLKFSQPAFTGLENSLDRLTIARHSVITSPVDFSLANLTKLTELRMKSNELRKVRNEWLNEKLPNLRVIVLDENEIIDIENEAFQNFPQLEMISLADNRIKTILRSMLPTPATALKKIDLSGNEIQSLPYEIFSNMPNLQKVILSGNDLQTLPETTWKLVWEQLSIVLLHENNIVCDENLDWLKSVKWPEIVAGSCVAPGSLAGKTLIEVYSNDK